MSNLLFYGTTDYGEHLSNSDISKFKELSNHFTTFVMTFGNKNQTLNHNYVTIHYIKKPSLLISKYCKFYFFNYYKLKLFCEQNKINIISAKDPIAAFLPIMIKKISNKKIKVIIEHHGDFIDLFLNQRSMRLNWLISKFLKLISIYTYKNCNLIRGVEEKYTKTLGNRYKKKNITFPAWVDHTIYKNNHLKRENIIFVGNIIPRKGVLFLIRNFYKYSTEFSSRETLLIIGKEENSQYVAECKKFIYENNIQNISFLGAKSHEELSNLYASSKLLIMGSNYEGLPRVLIESGLCGTPSLASNIQGIKDPFGTLGGTVTYKLDDDNEFIVKLNEILSSEDLQIELSKKAQLLSEKLSGKNSFLNNWIEIENKLNE